MASKNKIGLIIRHEYLMRVRKKSFWLVGLLTPIALVAVGVLIAFLAAVNESETTTVGLYDLSGRMASRIEGDDNLRFVALDVASLPLDSAKVLPLRDDSFKGVVVFPADTTDDYSVIERGTAMYYNENVPMSVQGTVASQVERIIKDRKIERLGVDPKVLASTDADVSIRLVDVSQEADEQTDGNVVQGIKLALAFILCFMLYMFMVFSGNMVMTSTLEEKTNRIVEVIISSVRPFELMIGKIISSGMVCITQLAIWVVMLTGLSIVGVAGLSSVLGPDPSEISPQVTEQMTQTVAQTAPQAVAAMETAGGSSGEMAQFVAQLAQIDFLSIGLVSIVFFILGYLLYASLYAAVGAAVDSAGDAGQFVMPITIPLLVAFYCAFLSVENPNGPVAFWMSMIPLTSPVMMMVRIPFGVPAWEVVVSALLLVAAFLAVTWMAAKIYRIGLLSYGNKPTYKDLWRWIRMN